MQDEVVKHTKKIYDTIKNHKYSAGEKIKETVIEIFIIVFAVTLSIWLHSWSDHRHEQKEVNEFLIGLKNYLNQDIQLLETNRSSSSKLDSNFNFMLTFKNNRVADTVKDVLINQHLSFDLRVTRPNIGRYEGFKSSGKMGTIQNDSLKENILKFYEQTIPDLVYAENYVNLLQSKILDLQLDKSDKMPISNFATSEKMQSLFGFGVHNIKVVIVRYDNAITQAKKIIAEIDKQTK